MSISTGRRGGTASRRNGAISATARAVTATICGQTEVGPVRPGNQDAIVVVSAVAAVTGTRLTWTGRVPEAGAVVGVVDGMGGYAGGADRKIRLLRLEGADLPVPDLAQDGIPGL